MKAMFIELFHYRYLLLMLTLRDIRIRYKQSIMGFLWALLMPMLVVAAGILVKKAFSIISAQPLSPADVATVSVKALPWAFFIAAIRFATTSLTSNMNLLNKIYFPRSVFPLSSVLANLFDFTIAAMPLTLILAATGIGISVYLLWVPILLLLFLLFTAAVAICLSWLNVFFRDVKYIVEVLLTFGIFFTPVIYDARIFGKWAPLLLLNPVGSLLEALNDTVVLHKSPDEFWLLYATCWAIGGFLISCSAFHKAERAFAEHI